MPAVFEIVGVVADVKNKGITSPVEPEIFVPADVVASRNSQGLLVKSAGAKMAMVRIVKHEIWAVNRGVAISDTESIGYSVRRFQFAEPQLGLFVFGALIVRLAFPLVVNRPWLGWPLFLAAMLAVAVVIGVVESVMARLRLTQVPVLLLAACLLSGFGIILLVR